MTGVLLAAALAAAPSGAAETVRVATLPALTSLGLFIAHDRGFFAAEGLTVELRTARSNEEILAALEDGTLDVGGAGFNAALYAAAARGGVRAVADKGRTGRRGFRMLVSARRGRPAGPGGAALKGRTFAFSVKGYESEIVLERFLRREGLTLADVRLTTVPYALMGEALAQGSAAGAVLIEPFLSDARRAGTVVEEADAADLYPGQQGAAVVFSRAFRERRRPAAVRFLAAYARACRWYRGVLAGEDAEKARLVALAARVLRRDPRKLEDMGWPDLDTDGRLEMKSVAADLRWHQERGNAPAGLTPGGLADPSLLEEALTR